MCSMLSRICLRKIVGSFFIESALVRQVSYLLTADGWRHMLLNQLFYLSLQLIYPVSRHTRKDPFLSENQPKYQYRCFSYFLHEHKSRKSKNGLLPLLLESALLSF